MSGRGAHGRVGLKVKIKGEKGKCVGVFVWFFLFARADSRRTLLSQPRASVALMSLYARHSGLHPLVDMLVECVLVCSALAFVVFFLFRARKRRGVTAFFHPYCNDGGGGERVLWCAVQALLERNPDLIVAIFTGDKEPKTEILSKAKERFSIDLTEHRARIKFVRIRCRALLQASCYPVATLLGQSIGGALLAVEALLRLTPDVFLDTMGSAPTYLVARYLAGCRVCCYVHYPTISSDMLELVEQRKTSFNNRAVISKSLLLSRAKLLYYRLLATAYGAAGRASHSTMVNSSWTRAHIADIWGEVPLPHVVFPPCNTANLQAIPLAGRDQLVISLGQFRPEKNHVLQLQAMAHLRHSHPDLHVRLVIIGSCRNVGDQARVAAVEDEIQRLGLSDVVQVRVNVSWGELRDTWLRRAKIGLHTMVNEHFGINIVEFMAAGVVPVAHNSGGPREDIVVPFAGNATGRLASCASSYAVAMHEILTMPAAEFAGMQQSARASVARFSDVAFQNAFCENWDVARQARHIFPAN